MEFKCIFSFSIIIWERVSARVCGHIAVYSINFVNAFDIKSARIAKMDETVAIIADSWFYNSMIMRELECYVLRIHLNLKSWKHDFSWVFHRMLLNLLKICQCTCVYFEVKSTPFEMHLTTADAYGRFIPAFPISDPDYSKLTHRPSEVFCSNQLLLWYVNRKIVWFVLSLLKSSRAPHLVIAVILLLP